MTNNHKKEIVDAALEYQKLHKLSVQKMSEGSGVNISYISHMLRHEYNVGETKITDNWFKKLAQFIGYKIVKTFIDLEQTTEFRKLIVKLEKAKEYQEHPTFIASTGRGKSFTIDIFKKANPNHTYVITVGVSYTVKDIIQEIAEALGLHVAGTQRMRLFAIIQKLRDIKLKGGKPVIIFDEGENLRLKTFQMLKELYDGISKHCGIVLIGTEQLLTMLETLKKRNKQGAPQLYRRLKAGIYRMEGGRQGLANHFVEKYVLDPKLKNLLYELCDNYGEFCDYMNPVFREADKLEVPVTEDLFRTVWDMPKMDFKRK